MSLYFLLSAACLVALPVLGAWFTGVEVLAPLWWRARLLRQGQTAPRLLLPAGGDGTSETRERRVRELIDEATATRGGAFAKDFVDDSWPRPIYIRTLARIVDEGGVNVGIPYTVEEHAQMRGVVVLFAVLDLRDHLSSKVLAHLEAGREDRAFGDEALIAGIMSGELRAALGRGDRLTVSDGFVVLESPFLLAERTPGPVKAALSRLAERLVEVSDPDSLRPRVGDLLAENLLEDEDVAVRAQAADVLLQVYPQRADWAAARALSDEAPEVRFSAARHLGEEGQPFILQIIFDERAEESDHATEGLRQRALRFFVREFSKRDAMPVLQRALEEGPDGLRQIALRKLGEMRHVEGLNWMEQALSAAHDPETVVAGCEALARIGHQSGEGILVRLLDRPEPVIQRAAVDALAQVGTVGSAGALNRLAQSATDREVRLSAMTALPIVQTRGAPEALGALSIVDEGGALALAAGEDEA